MSEWKINNIKKYIHSVQHLLDCCLVGGSGGSSGASGTLGSFLSCSRTRSLKKKKKNIYIYIYIVVVVRGAS